MKKLLALLVLTTTVAHAEVITVLETTLPQSSSADIVDTRFHTNKTTGEGGVSVSVAREEYRYNDGWGGGYGGPWGGPMGCDQFGRCYPRRPMPMPVRITYFEDTVMVDGLSMHGDRLIYAAQKGDVVCGKMGLSRILRKPTLFLTGKCKIDSRIRGRKLIVTLQTK